MEEGMEFWLHGLVGNPPAELEALHEMSYLPAPGLCPLSQIQAKTHCPARQYVH